MARLPKPSGVCRFVFFAAGLVGSSVANIDCFAYTAAGDRIFAPTGILPQIAPSDQIYTWGWTLPLSGEAVGTRSRMTNVGAFFDKTLTERLSLYFQGSWFQIDRVGTESLYGFGNFENGFKYLTVNDPRPRISADTRGQSRMGRHRGEPDRRLEGRDGAAALFRQGSGRSRHRLSAAARGDRIYRLPGRPMRSRVPIWSGPALPSSTRSPICNRRCKASIFRLWSAA